MVLLKIKSIDNYWTIFLKRNQRNKITNELKIAKRHRCTRGIWMNIWISQSFQRNSRFWQKMWQMFRPTEAGRRSCCAHQVLFISFQVNIIKVLLAREWWRTQHIGRVKDWSSPSVRGGAMCPNATTMRRMLVGQRRRLPRRRGQAKWRTLLLQCNVWRWSDETDVGREPSETWTNDTRRRYVNFQSRCCCSERKV